MDNILFVRNSKSPLAIAIEARFHSDSSSVTVIRPEVEMLIKKELSFDGVLLYVDGELMAQQHFLYRLVSISEKGDIPIFLVGQPEELQIISRTLPGHLVCEEYKRPVKVTAMVDDVLHNIRFRHTQKKKRILYVDDSGAMLRTVKGWLEATYNVSLANSAALAIKSITLNKPHLILLDMEMPVCDGKKVLEMIRAESEFSSIPAMFLTVKDDSASILSVMPLKPDAYLLKTMPPADILKAINTFFKKK